MNVLDFAIALNWKLVAKLKQARLARDFQYYKMLAENRPLSDEQYTTYEKYYEEMRHLNQKGVGKI